jgi:microcin C transport system substrate-binding protein
MDEFNFDMTWSAWGAGVRKDPESMWYGKEANKPKSNNYPGFRNAEVDKLIEAQREIFDIERRHDMVRTIDRIVYAAYPYALLWYTDHTRLLYWNKFGTPPWVLSKYGDEYAAIAYWWLDPDAVADLEDAMANGDSLPKKAIDVRFSEEFREP